MKTFGVKVYTNTDSYLTNWDSEIVNDISFVQQINSAGGQLQLTLARNAGDYGEGTDVDFGHKVKIYSYDIDELDGVLIYQGFISSYTPIYADNRVEVTLLSYGEELNRFMLQSAFDLDNSVIVTNGVLRDVGSPTYAPLSVIGGDRTGSGDWFATGVKFTTPASMTTLAQIDVCFTPANGGPTTFEDALEAAVTLTLYPLLTSGARNGYPDYNNPLGTVTLPAGTQSTTDVNEATKNAFYDHNARMYAFNFGSGVEVTPSTDYVFVLESPDGDIVSIFGNTYADVWTDYYFNGASVTTDSYTNYQYNYEFKVGADTYRYGQTFAPSSSIMLANAQFYMRKSGSPTGNLVAYITEHTGTYGVNGVPTGDPIATSDSVAVSSLAAGLGWITFTFSGSNSILLDSTKKYCVFVSADAASDPAAVFISGRYTTPGHAGNYISSLNGGAWSGFSSEDLLFAINGSGINTTARNYYNFERSAVESESYSTDNVIPFIAYSADGSTTVAYNSYDPGAIMRDIIDKYRLQGGVLNYTTDTIELCGTEVSYTFSSNTVYEGISKCLELAPTGWYWYVDYATNLVHFHQSDTTPNHTLSLEKDLKDAKFEKRIEDLINTIYFTGGGDPPLYKKFTNQNSVIKYGIKAAKYIDQRVTVLATAQAITDAILSTKSQPELRVTLEVIDNNVDDGLGYDIESIKVGDAVSVRNVSQQVGLSTWDIARWDNDYWDFNIYNLSSLQMVIQEIKYTADILTIKASTIMPDVNKRIEDINRNLETLQTLNNPDTPEV